MTSEISLQAEQTPKRCNPSQACLDGDVRQCNRICTDLRWPNEPEHPTQHYLSVQPQPPLEKTSMPDLNFRLIHEKAQSQKL
jgi:hypothetical protein